MVYYINNPYIYCRLISIAVPDFSASAYGSLSAGSKGYWGDAKKELKLACSGT